MRDTLRTQHYLDCILCLVVLAFISIQLEITFQRDNTRFHTVNLSTVTVTISSQCLLTTFLSSYFARSLSNRSYSEYDEKILQAVTDIYRSNTAIPDTVERNRAGVLTLTISQERMASCALSKLVLERFETNFDCPEDFLCSMENV